MGALAFWGGLAGAGRGMSQVGAQMEQDQRYSDRERAQMEREILRQASLDNRNIDNQAMRHEIAAMREEGRAARAGGAGGAGGKGGGAMGVKDFMNDPAALALAGGGTREEADQALDVARNGAGQMVDRAVEDESGGHAEKALKYEPGQASKIAERGRAMLMQAMKLGDPGHADDLSTSEKTDYLTDAARRAEKGDQGAVRGALAVGHKGEFDADGSSVITGKNAPGSLGEAKTKTEGAKQGAEGALARKRNEEANSDVDKRSGKGSIKEDLARIDSERKGIDNQLRDVRAQEAAALKNFDMSDDAKAEIKQQRKDLEARARTLASRYDTLDAKIAGKSPEDMPKPKPEPAKPKAAVEKLPAGAKQIGTSQGRPVYQTPDGKRFIGG